MLIHSAEITGSVQFNNTDVSGITSVAGFASTGSNQFNGNQSISGSITSNGTITAQTLVVQTVTSSVEFVTGSTRNGSLSSNTHQFTGSLFQTGSTAAFMGNVGIGTTSPTGSNTSNLLHLNGSNAVLRVGPWLNDGFGDRDFVEIIANSSDTKITSPNNRFYVENTTGDIIISAAGNTGIGTTIPNSKLSVNGNTSITGSVDITGSLAVNNNLLVTGSVTAAGAIARSTYITPTLVASANNDTLVGLDINPTYNTSSFTGVSNYGVRVQGNNLLATVGKYGLQLANTTEATSVVTQQNSPGLFFSGNAWVGGALKTNDILIQSEPQTWDSTRMIYSKRSNNGSWLPFFGLRSDSTSQSSLFLYPIGYMKDAVGQALSSGFAMSNGISATSTVQQYSPSYTIQGQGWNGTDSSLIYMDWVVAPEAGTSNIQGVGKFVYQNSLNNELARFEWGERLGMWINKLSLSNFTTTINSYLITTGSITASSSLARGLTITNTLSASANSDTLIGLDINPTFTNGAFTGVTNYAIRLANNQFIGARDNASTNYNAIGINNSNTLVIGSGAINSSFNGATLDLGSNSVAGIRFFNGTQWGQIFGGTGNFILQNGGTFTDAGYRLDVSGSTRLNGNTTVTGSIDVSGSITSNGTITAQTLVVQTVTSSIEFVTGSTRNGSIAGNTHQFTGSVLMSGSVGIGTSSPSQKLHISDSTSVYCRIVNTAGADVYLGAESTQGVLSVNNNLPLDVRTNNITRLYINTSGSIGVGITPNTGWNSFTTLQLGGNTYSAVASSNHYLNIAANSYYDGTNFRYISNGFTSRYQLSDGTHLWYVAGSGTAGNTINYTNVMTITNTGQIALSNSPGIRFVSGSSDLNYYTTSTWTPQFAAGGTTSFGLASQTGTGRYTRIGNVVTIHGQIVWNGAGSSGTNLLIQTLPFRVAGNVRGGIGMGLISGIGDISAGGLQLVPELNSFVMYLITHTNDGSGHIHLSGGAVKNNGSKIFSFAGSYITDE